jgi:hypothetical protein
MNMREAHKNRRHNLRHTKDSCVGLIGNKTYPVRDWSFGGVLLTADERLFPVDGNLSLTLKFRLKNKILDVAQNGQIIRKTKDKIALKFGPLTTEIESLLRQVIEDRESGTQDV